MINPNVLTKICTARIHVADHQRDFWLHKKNASKKIIIPGAFAKLQEHPIAALQKPDSTRNATL